MNCGECGRKVRKEIKIDDVLLCYKCKQIKLNELVKFFHIKGLKVLAPYINNNQNI
jgi:hypothetical protein